MVDYVSKNRIETLVDGIFAIAMTLLVLSLVVPDIKAPVTASALQHALLGIVPSLISVIVSFIMLALFWNIHHKIYSKIKVVSPALLWVNIIWLLFIVLVPFSTSLTGQYGDFTISKLIFNINMLGIASLLLLNVHLLLGHSNLHEEGFRDKLISSRTDTSIFILVVFLAIFLSFIIPAYSDFAYFIILGYEIIGYVIEIRNN